MARRAESLATYLDRWLEVRCYQVEPRTYQGYRDNVNRYIRPMLGRIPLTKLCATDLDRLYADMRAGGLSPRTIQYCHATIRKALNDAVRKGVIDKSPVGAADPPRVRRADRPQMQTWTAPQLSEFLSQICYEPKRALWHVAATTGARQGELLRLRRSDVSDTTVTIMDSKSGRGRRVEIDPATAAVLRDHPVIDRERPEIFFPYTQWQVSKEFQRLIRRLGLPKMRFHDLRHTHATLLLTAGVHPKIVSERLGHAGIEITLNTYSHVIEGMGQVAVDALMGLLGPPS